MREGKSCQEAQSKLKTLLQYPSERLDFESLVPLSPGEVQKVFIDMDVQEDEEEVDPLM